MQVPCGPVAKLVDALDLGSSAAMCESSSLSGPTILKLAILINDWNVFFIIIDFCRRNKGSNKSY